MKAKSYLSLLLFCVALLTLSACSSDDDDKSPEISTAAPGAGWKVSLFKEPGEDKTADYSGYTFEFADSGTIKLTGNNKAVSGIWQQFQNDGVTKFKIGLNVQDKDLESLNHDWVIVAKTDKLISLKDDNSSSNEQLQFTKN
ncbi:hypothetical protein [Dyadobacter luticola]|uniref:Lipocalin-like domain-containing protein n=1 Tax=Dyadobacter luticola TaxID=1979387 RepID=A0A5R9L0T9_9BACT|nr:hypothetical protein [Dyadobacter luticola]TLV02166.1 hypothetical protein FEN17_00550 [Dyadobacter luticola]